MELNEYQRQAREFATGGGLTLEYALLGLAEEAGEVAGKAAKFVRKKCLPMEHLRADCEWSAKLQAELGDCLWMIANAAASIGVELDDLAHANICKLTGRRERGTIIGEGDVR